METRELRRKFWVTLYEETQNSGFTYNNWLDRLVKETGMELFEVFRGAVRNGGTFTEAMKEVNEHMSVFTEFDIAAMFYAEQLGEVDIVSRHVAEVIFSHES